MKRIPILFVFVAAMSLFSCSKGDDSTPKLELKETNYNLIVNEEVQLELVNTVLIFRIAILNPKTTS